MLSEQRPGQIHRLTRIDPACNKMMFAGLCVGSPADRQTINSTRLCVVKNGLCLCPLCAFACEQSSSPDLVHYPGESISQLLTGMCTLHSPYICAFTRCSSGALWIISASEKTSVCVNTCQRDAAV